MQHSMLHTIYTLLSVPTQVPNGLLSSFQSAVPLLAEIDSKNYQSWQQQLIELAQQIDHAAQRKALNHKTVVGFGGGFSAGKSRFINSLLGIDVLPEALEPCTAVATYLTHSPQESTQACNLFGHQIQLKSKQLGQLRHFVDSADSINLGQLIRHVHLGLPEITWSNIALLDTPGYSKADSQHHGQNDENIALTQLSAAQHVVWLVNAKNGTIRDEDLQFLQQLELSNPIFVVLTQSDLVNRADFKPIMDGISKHLASKNVAVAGIMAWAAPISQNRGERLVGDDILEWFEQINQPVWQSYQDKLDLLMGRLIPSAQAELATVAKQHQQMSGLLSLPELTAEQKKIIERHVTEKTNKKIQLNIALIKLQDHHTTWSKSIAELAIDSSLTVEGILQQNHSDEDVRFFYEMAKSHCQNTALSNSDKALSGYVKAATNGHAAALQALTTLANGNDSKACYWLAEIQLKSTTNPKSQIAKLYEKALVLGESQALTSACKMANDDFDSLQYQIGKVYSEGKITQRNLTEAAAWYKKSAERKNILAQLELANYLYQHLNDTNGAIVWYKAAVSQNSADGAFQLGLIYNEIGEIDEAVAYIAKAAKSYNAEALAWLKKSESSCQPAAYQLACIYESGHGVKKSVDTAIQKYAVLACKGYSAALQRLETLASQKNKEAIYNLADLSESHFNDLTSALRYHIMAIEYYSREKSLKWLYDQSCCNLQDAQDSLKLLADILQNTDIQYTYGLFQAQNGDQESASHYMGVAAKLYHTKALSWLEQHEANFQSAAYCLAQMYETGNGVSRSVDTAIKKYAVLVLQKHVDAMQNLMALANQHHHNALLTIANIAESYLKDLPQAAKWHSMAVEYHDDQQSLQWLYDQSCSGLQDAQDCLKSLADRLKRASLQYHYGLSNAYRNQNKTACDYMALAATQKYKEAREWLEQREGIFQLAAYYLAQMYEIGEGVNKSVDTAIKKYAVLVRQKHTDALERLLGLADERHLNAMLALADIAESYLKDIEQATKWHGMAVEHHDDQKSLQWLYDQSCSGLQDAQDCLKSLADRLKRANLQYRYGLLSAYKNLNETACHYMSLAASQNFAEAYQWLKQKSAKNDIAAQSKMMHLFEDGKANQEDTKTIFDYYYLAIRRGDAKAFQAVSLHAAKEIDVARHLLATCYAFGYGMEKSYVKAYQLYEQSSAIPDFYYNRAVMLYLGLGVKQDRKSAIFLMERNRFFPNEIVKKFSNPLMLNEPVLVDFYDQKKIFNINFYEIFKLSLICFFSLGLIYFFDGIGALASMAIIFIFTIIRLVNIGKFSKQRTMIINSNTGTWYDASTKMTWMRCSLGQIWNGKNCVGNAQQYTWEEAQRAVAEMNRNGGYAGHTDWVVPDLDMLASLQRKCKEGAQLDQAIFPNTPAYFYWTSSSRPGYESAAWAVYFSGGVSGSGGGYPLDNGKGNHYHVRAVRAGR